MTSALGSARIRQPRSASSLAALAGGVALLIAAVAIVPLASAAHELVDAVFPLAFAPVFGAVGVIVALRQPRNAVRWLLVGVALLVGGSFDVETYAYLIYHVGDHGLPLGRVAVALGPCWYPGLILLPLPILLFPDGRLPSRRWRRVLALYAVNGAVTLATVGWLDAPALLDRRIRVDSSGQLPTIDNPVGWESAVLHASLLLFLTAMLVAVFVSVVAVTMRVLPFSSPVAVAASTLAAAALFNPLRLRVQRVVDRRFNRARYAAERIVAAFAARLRDAVDLETVRADLLSAARSVQPAHASVWIRPRSGGS